MRRSKRRYVVREVGPPTVRPATPAARDAECEPDPEPAPDPETVARRRFGRSLHELVAEAAYRRWVARAGGPGSSEADWCAAEAEVRSRLAEPEGSP